MRKYNYLVGCKNEGSCVYGDDGSYIFPMTLSKAKRLSKKIYTWDDEDMHKVIYKLIEVKIKQ